MRGRVDDKPLMLASVGHPQNPGIRRRTVGYSDTLLARFDVKLDAQPRNQRPQGWLAQAHVKGGSVAGLQRSAAPPPCRPTLVSSYSLPPPGRARAIMCSTSPTQAPMHPSSTPPDNSCIAAQLPLFLPPSHRRWW